MTENISLGIKFTSKNLQELLNEHWEQSFIADYVIFDLGELEWINTEELAVWYGWLYQLIEKKKIITIKLQNGRDVNASSPVYKRRQRALSNMVYRSGLFSKFMEQHYDSHGKLLLSFDIRGGMAPSEKYLPKYEDSLVPFYKIRANEFQSEDASNNFEIEQRAMFTEYPLEESISRALESERLNQLDNYALSYIIPKELYTNACHHAYASGKSIFAKECYLTLGYEKRITNSEQLNFVLRLRNEEKVREHAEFYDFHKNKSFLSFSFLDFGIGIPESLKGKYEQDMEISAKKAQMLRFFSPGHLKAIEDSRILEYALLLSTSRNELEDNLIFHDYIPRGLYVIKDIVKRNNGLLSIRSGKGRITYDYSQSQDDLRHIVKYHQGNDRAEFPGTLITIVLPSKAAQKVAKQSDIKIKYIPNEFNYIKIDLLRLYLKAYHKIGTVKNLTNEREITKVIFGDISQILLELNNEGASNNVLFDFAGIDVKKHDFSRVLFYYLILSPLINEKNQGIIINIVNSKILHAYGNLVESLKDDGTENKTNIKEAEIRFLQKPIPCILGNGKIVFIGLEEQNFQETLKNGWLTNESQFSDRQLGELSNFHFTKIISSGKATDQDQLQIRLPGIKDLFNAIINFNTRSIACELDNDGISFSDLYYIDENELVHDYNDVLFKDPLGKWYFTTNGKYQDSFISFIEKLYKKQYRQLIATYLVFAYSINASKKLNKEQVNKILTVTLSSQLLGREVKEILDELNVSPPGSKEHELKITLIPLSNYYDFEQEEPFKEIGKGDQVLVVNDVISTGNLSDKIFTSITSSKTNAQVAGLLTIVDSRIDKTLYSNIAERVVSLCERPIQLADTLPAEATGVIWISPLVNAPITMKRKNSEDFNVLFPVEEFLKEINDQDLVVIGHIKHNTLHHTYYLRASEIYKADRLNGYKLFRKMFLRLNENKRKKDDSKVTEKSASISDKFALLSSEIMQLSELLVKQTELQGMDRDHAELVKKLGSLNERVNLSNDRFHQMQNEIELATNSPQLAFNAPNFDVDYVFIPFLSSAMNIMDDLPNIYRAVNSDKILEVYPIPRIMTPKGWRFTFPPKFLNKVTQNANVFILDDGSWTGETLIQMIDSICFLAISEITVLSIVARFDDYQREFLSRIQRIKAKHDTININIFFGTHLHIPLYSSESDSCPFIAEEKELKKIAKLNRQQSIDDYIKMRLEQIHYIDNTINPHANNPSNIPATISKTAILLLRNFIGKYEGFRLYEDDVKDIVEFKGELFKDMDVFMAIILHEPYLLKVIERLDLKRNASDKLKLYLSEILSGKCSTEWDKISVVKAQALLYPELFVSFEELKKISDFCQNDKNAINFLSYTLFKNVQGDDDTTDPKRKRLIIKNVQLLYDEIKYRKEDLNPEDYIEKIKSVEYEALRQLLNQLNIIALDGDAELTVVSLSLLEIFKTEKTEGQGHESLSRDLRQLITKAYNSLSVLDDDENDEENNDGLSQLWEHNVKPILQKIMRDVNLLDYLGVFNNDELLIKLKRTLLGKGNLYPATISENPDRFLAASIDRIDHWINSPINRQIARSIRDEASFVINSCISPNAFPAIFFYQFGVSLGKLWKEVFLHFKADFVEKGFIIDNNSLLLGQSDIVAIHQYILSKILTSFLQNFNDHLPENSRIVFTIRVNQGYCILDAVQNYPFDFNRPGGLGINRIVKMLVPYKGVFEFPKDNKPLSANEAVMVQFTLKIPLL